MPHNGDSQALSGRLAEEAVYKLFHLKEGELIEVKAFQLERKHVHLEMSQLERQQHKVYICVGYSRGKRKTLASGRREYERSIEEGFKASLTIYFFKGYEIANPKLFKDVRLVSNGRDSRARYVARLNVKEHGADKAHTLWQGHVVYGADGFLDELMEVANDSRS